jgi:hypothetical protein
MNVFAPDEDCLNLKWICVPLMMVATKFRWMCLPSMKIAWTWSGSVCPQWSQLRSSDECVCPRWWLPGLEVNVCALNDRNYAVQTNGECLRWRLPAWT